MSEVVGKLFQGWRERGSGLAFADLSFVDCEFVSCAMCLTVDVRQRPTVERSTLTRCKIRNVSANATVFRQCTVDGLHVEGQLTAFGALFDRVVLKGDIGFFRTWPAPLEKDPAIASAERVNAFETAGANILCGERQFGRIEFGQYSEPRDGLGGKA